jgi:hypothetical protein
LTLIYLIDKNLWVIQIDKTQIRDNYFKTKWKDTTFSNTSLGFREY